MKKRLPKYCGYCGNKLKIQKVQDGFSTITGEKRYIYVFKCPQIDKLDASDDEDWVEMKKHSC